MVCYGGLRRDVAWHGKVREFKEERGIHFPLISASGVTAGNWVWLGQVWSDTVGLGKVSYGGVWRGWVR